MGSCPLCGNLAVRRLALPHTAVWECASQRCGLRYASPQLDERSLQAAYRKLYYPDLQRAGTRPCKATRVEIRHQVFRHAIAEFGDLSGWRLLDYGCGTGSLCKAALSYGLRSVGIESDANAYGQAIACGRYPVYQRLEDLLASEPSIRFDMIALWEVIEHLRVPWIDVANLRRVLRTDGCLLVSTPNARCAKPDCSGRAGIAMRTQLTSIISLEKLCASCFIRVGSRESQSGMPILPILIMERFGGH